MVRVLVLYDSESGGTEKMALAVMEDVRQVQNVDVVLRKVTDTSLDDLERADGIIVGSPTFYGLMSGKLKLFFMSLSRFMENLRAKSEVPSHLREEQRQEGDDVAFDPSGDADPRHDSTG